MGNFVFVRAPTDSWMDGRGWFRAVWASEMHVVGFWAYSERARKRGRARERQRGREREREIERNRDSWHINPCSVNSLELWTGLVARSTELTSGFGGSLGSLAPYLIGRQERRNPEARTSTLSTRLWRVRLRLSSSTHDLAEACKTRGFNN